LRTGLLAGEISQLSMKEVSMETVYRFKPESEFCTEERCYIVELANTSSDETCSIARARVEPGVITCLHAVLDTVERYVILEGEGEVEIGDNPAVWVGPLDVVRIPRNVPQRIRNVGQTDLIFLAICTPRFRQEAYVDLENVL
jgi:mannose-6-phosphate isomerase-like protein (cupin superfamily)